MDQSWSARITDSPRRRRRDAALVGLAAIAAGAPRSSRVENADVRLFERQAARFDGACVLLHGLYYLYSGAAYLRWTRPGSAGPALKRTAGT